MNISVMKLASCLALAAACSAQSVIQGSRGEPVATVGGQPIYEQELVAELGPRLLQLRNQEYQVKSQALEELIRKKVVEAEAQKRGISIGKLYEEEADSKVSEPTDAEVGGYYLAVKAQLNQPLQEIRPQLQKAVKLLKIAAAREDYADSLRAKAQVAVMLRPPKVEVSYDAARVRGNPTAPVTIVEFSDFQCPYCKKAQDTLKDLLVKYKDQVKLAFRDFPMRTLHAQAQMAAEASRCAGEQGKFWEYHDALFADQTTLSQAGLVETAQSLGMDRNSFESCLATGKFKAQIEQDVQNGTKVGVAGTPGFFINGVFVNGAQPAAEFDKIIEGELAAIRNRNSTRASR